MNETNCELDYSQIIQIFIQLRGKGVSLSSVDLEVVRNWEDRNISPDFIFKVLYDFSEECKLKSKPFPVSLLPISRKVETILRYSTEY